MLWVFCSVLCGHEKLMQVNVAFGGLLRVSHFIVLIVFMTCSKSDHYFHQSLSLLIHFFHFHKRVLRFTFKMWSSLQPLQSYSNSCVMMTETTTGYQIFKCPITVCVKKNGSVWNVDISFVSGLEKNINVWRNALICIWTSGHYHNNPMFTSVIECVWKKFRSSQKIWINFFVFLKYPNFDNLWFLLPALRYSDGFYFSKVLLQQQKFER